jgi:hypothetical protein
VLGSLLILLAVVPRAWCSTPAARPDTLVLYAVPDTTLLWWPRTAPSNPWSPVAALLLPTQDLLVADKAQNRLYLIRGRDAVPVRLPEPSPPPVEWTALSGAPGLALYALDGPGGKVHQFDFKGNYLGVAVDFDAVSLANGLGRVDARGLAVDRSGRAVVTDRQNDRVLLFGPGWSFLGVLGETGSGLGAWRRPTAAAASEKGWFLIVDEGNHRVVLLDAVGSVKTARATKEVPQGVSALGPDRFAIALDNRVDVVNAGLDLEASYPVPAGPRCGGASYATPAVTGTRECILVGEGCSGRLLELRIRGD